MPLGSGLVHPLMTAALRGNFLRSRCTIWQLSANVQNSLGERQRTWPDDYEQLTGHAVIPCAEAPLEGTTGELTERRQSDATYDQARKNVLLDAEYPLVEVQMVAVIDNVAYDILGVQKSAVGGVTSMVVELIR